MEKKVCKEPASIFLIILEEKNLSSAQIRQCDLEA